MLLKHYYTTTKQVNGNQVQLRTIMDFIPLVFNDDSITDHHHHHIMIIKNMKKKKMKKKKKEMKMIIM